MNKRERKISRSDFLKLSAAALGGAALACGRADEIVQMTATLVPDVPTQAPAATAVPTAASPAVRAAEAADTVLVNGNLYTMDAAVPAAQALAVKDGLILQVGSDEAIRALLGEATQVIDAGGKTVTPGLIDAHNHLQVYGSLLERFVQLLPPEVATLDSLLAKVSSEVAHFNPGDWVQGVYWTLDRTPDRFDLDSVSPDNPVWIMQQGGHYGIANSAALRVAGIDANTQSPTGGVIEKDANGEPTGRFYNHRAMDVLRMHAPIPTTEDMLGYMDFAGDLMVAVGVTSFQDCNVRFNALDAYFQAGQNKNIGLRGQIFYTLEWPADLERALNEMPEYADDFIRFAGYKFLIDGQYPTWYTHEPHPGISWDMPTWDPDLFKEAVGKLHDTGLQVAIHCGGDAAVDLALDAIEGAMNANPRLDPRHRLEHAVLTKPHATQRAADLGVSISCQPQFLRFAAYVGDEIGEERAARLKVTREWLDAGVNVALGSDAGSTPWYEPQVTMLAAVNRYGPDDKPFHPEQAMTIQEALYAHSMGSAIAGHMETVKGSLTPGKFADLVVWSDDYYTIPSTHIGRVKADLTMIDGQVVHEA